jgi:hypothetical protein
VGVVAHQDGDLGNAHGLGDALGVHKLFVGVVGDLIVDRDQPVVKEMSTVKKRKKIF